MIFGCKICATWHTLITKLLLNQTDYCINIKAYKLNQYKILSLIITKTYK